MHRSPPPAADSSGDIGGDRNNSGSRSAAAAADAATADSTVLATEQAELQRLLAGLRAPLPMPPAVASQQQRQSGAAVREQQIRAALAHCWEVGSVCVSGQSSHHLCVSIACADKQLQCQLSPRNCSAHDMWMACCAVSGGGDCHGGRVC